MVQRFSTQRDDSAPLSLTGAYLRECGFQSAVRGLADVWKGLGAAPGLAVEHTLKRGGQKIISLTRRSTVTRGAW